MSSRRRSRFDVTAPTMTKPRPPRGREEPGGTVDGGQVRAMAESRSIGIFVPSIMDSVTTGWAIWL
jgi:hypothetical protein